jgi:hypothetical protein
MRQFKALQLQATYKELGGSGAPAVSSLDSGSPDNLDTLVAGTMTAGHVVVCGASNQID